MTALNEALADAHASSPTLAIGIVGEDLVVGDMPVPRAAENMGELMRRLQQAGVERIVIDRGVEAAELTQARAGARGRGRDVRSPPLGRPAATFASGACRSRTQRRRADRATSRRSTASTTTRCRWRDDCGTARRREGKPDPNAGRGIVDSLAQAVAQNRTALLALTALKNYDNYTFTHMVNVSILTMGQARGLGIDGALLREFGLAALMHDIGKVRTPTEILNKPDKLDDREFEIMKRHIVDGAEILRRTPEMPTLAPIVAFEHHLRLDGTGYPIGVIARPAESRRRCCAASPTSTTRCDRSAPISRPFRPTASSRCCSATTASSSIRTWCDGSRSSSASIPPATSSVSTTGEIAVVMKAYAPDPYRRA